ncbi:MAG: ion channel [Ignavibacteriae bacterium]|nr:ion channel [Ignavibacteriota bacterium]
MSLLKKLTESWKKENSMTLLLLSIVIYLFILAPILEDNTLGKIIRLLFFLLLILSGAASVSDDKKFKVFVFIFAGLSFFTKWIAALIHSNAILVSDIFGILYFILLTYIISIHIFRSDKITIHKIMGSVVLYLLIGIIFAYIFEIIVFFSPGSISISSNFNNETDETKLLYYSYVVLTTTGFGDITPVSNIARTVTIIEALIGQLFPAILIARLVSAEIAVRMSRTEQKDE